jgi:hypothetical protein
MDNQLKVLKKLITMNEGLEMSSGESEQPMVFQSRIDSLINDISSGLTFLQQTKVRLEEIYGRNSELLYKIDDILGNNEDYEDYDEPEEEYDEYEYTEHEEEYDDVVEEVSYCSLYKEALMDIEESINYFSEITKQLKEDKKYL